MFDSRDEILTKIFIDETNVQLSELEDHLIQLENGADPKHCIHEIFRLVHSLKGAAVTMKYRQITELAHEMEGLLEYIRDSKQNVREDVLDILYEGLDMFQQILISITEGTYPQCDIQPVLTSIRALLPAEEYQQVLATKSKKHLFRISEYEAKVIEDAIQKKESVYLIYIQFDDDAPMKGVKALLVSNNLKERGYVLRTYPENMDYIIDEDVKDGFYILIITTTSQKSLTQYIQAVGDVYKIQISQIKSDFRRNGPLITVSSDVRTKFDFRQNIRNDIRVDISRLNQLTKILCEFIKSQKNVDILMRNLQRQYPDDYHVRALVTAFPRMSRVEQDLLDILVDIRLCSVENVFNRFPRLIRELARRSGKQIRFEVTGKTTKIDKAILEMIVDPIVHLLRNAADHGIELPVERKQKGKDETGHIRLSVVQGKERINVEIEDDGRGIDLHRVKEKALQMGLKTKPELENMDKQALIHLIYTPGFSTSDVVSEISGRGIGMDVVKTNIEKLQGDIEIVSEEGKGTKVKLTIPTTFSLNFYRSMLM